MDLLRQIEAVLFTADERILDRIELADRADPSIYPVLSISTPQHPAAHASRRRMAMRSAQLGLGLPTATLFACQRVQRCTVYNLQRMTRSPQFRLSCTLYDRLCAAPAANACSPADCGRVRATDSARSRCCAHRAG